MFKQIVIVVFVVFLAAGDRLHARVLDDTPPPGDVVLRYHQALSDGDSAALVQTLGSHISMFNGAGSADQMNWQAHMFLSDDQVTEWAAFMATGAGPHTNKVSLMQTDIRAGMSLVITQETGSNKFLSWEKARFVYMLGQEKGYWKIVGLFLPEASNPD